MRRSQQRSKRSRNRRLVGSFNALQLAEKADKGPEKILPSVPLTSSRTLSENAPARVLSATSDRGDDGRHHYRRFLDCKPKEEFPEGSEPVPLSVNKVVDSVCRSSSPNGKVAFALPPNTLEPLSRPRPPLGPKHDALSFRTVRSPQPKPDTSTSYGQKIPPSTTPPRPNIDTPAPPTANSSQPKPDTPTSHGQKRLPLVTPPRSNLDTPAVSTVNSLKPKPDTPTSRGQERLPPVTPPRPNLDAPTLSTVYSSRPDADTPPMHGTNSLRSISATDDLSRPALVTTQTRPRATLPSSSASASPGGATVRCSGITRSNRQCLRTVRVAPTHATLNPLATVYCYQHQRPAADDLPRPAFVATPTIPRSTPSSSFASAFSGGVTVRCSGTTQSNRQCLRTVRLPPTHAISDPLPVVYCYQHRRPAFVATPTGPRVTPSLSSAPAFSGQVTVQCSGTTKSNRQCLRTVRLPSTHATSDLVPTVYCYQHRRSAADDLPRPAFVATPTEPRVPPSLSSASAFSGRVTVRCSGTTKSNRQCLRTVRLPPTHAISDPVPTVYCYQHRRSAADDLPRPAFVATLTGLHATPSSSSASAFTGQVTARCSGTTKSNRQCLRTVRLPPTHSISDPLPIVYCYQHRRPAFVATPTSPHATPSSSSASSFPGQLAVQCGGTTKADRQCSRTVKLPPTHAMLDPIPAAYCYQHRNTKETGFYVKGVGRADRYVEFKDYVPEYLRGATQLALKEEMARALSKSDRPGYIYALEIRDPSTAHLIQLKVGRTVNLKRRLDQWDKQCGVRQQVLRGWWPGTIEPDSDSDTNGSLLRTQLKAGDPGPLCHRLERLIHIELADLSLYAPYLEPEWPQTNNSEQSLSVAGSLSSAPSAVQRAGDCKDCGVVHREIFSFRRPNGGKYEGREWDDIVKPVIEKWGRFVKEYYS